MPLSSAGYTIPTEDATFEEIVADFESRTNTTVDRLRTDDQLVPALAKVIANVVRKRDEEVLTVYNAGSVNSATGRRLEDLVGIVGVTPKAATYTTDTTAAVTGTVGTTIPVNTLVEYGDNRFRVVTGRTLTGSGDTVQLQAVQAGDSVADRHDDVDRHTDSRVDGHHVERVGRNGGGRSRDRPRTPSASFAEPRGYRRG